MVGTMNDDRRRMISKAMSYLLRHNPEKFHVLLDPEGFAHLDDLIKALGRKYKGLTKEDVLEVVSKCEKGRFEINGEDIRACYGHSISTRINYKPIGPPEVLLHGTARRFVDEIMKEGLKPMDRQYVHLTVREDFAREVGRRRDRDPVILKVEARKAYMDGIKFYKANENFYLADYIPARYLIAP